MSTVALIDAGGANLGSVRYALERLGADIRLVPEPAALEGCARVILPGVGAAAPAMALLRERGLDVALQAWKKPLLGICLGMQLLFERSEEGDVDCLGLLPGSVRRLPASPGLRVPHMGWNRLRHRRASALTRGIPEGGQAYFVHAYAAPANGTCLASFEHGAEFAAVVGEGNAWGAQFHPERSAALGARLLSNFMSIEP